MKRHNDPATPGQEPELQRERSRPKEDLPPRPDHPSKSTGTMQHVEHTLDEMRASGDADVQRIYKRISRAKIDRSDAVRLSQNNYDLLPEATAALALGHAIGLNPQELLDEGLAERRRAPNATRGDVLRHLLLFLRDKKPFGTYIAELAAELLSEA